jgi:hypothetical protein
MAEVWIYDVFKKNYLYWRSVGGPVDVAIISKEMGLFG